MKMSGICALLAALLVGLLATADANAFGRRYMSAPGYYYNGHGPMFYFGPGLDYSAFYGGAYYADPHFNPYIAPFPEYGIMPPPFATKQIVDAWGPGRRAPADSVYPFTEPHKRPSTYPAIPYNDTAPPPPDPQADVRRVKFVVNVPTDDTVVIFDGKTTTKTGQSRTFRTAPLEEDRLYSYKIQATWVDQAGKKQMREEERKFVAGETITVTFK